MDALTERLHEAAEALPDTKPAASQVRHGAEHGRRIRRAVAGSAVAGVLAVVAVGVGVLGGGARPQLAPRCQHPVFGSRLWGACSSPIR